MHEWIRNKIKSSMEYKARVNPALNEVKTNPTDAVVVMDEADDDLPF
jgi:hypothetical protein